MLRRVENYLRYQNQMRLRRVAIAVKVLSIETADSSNYSVDVTGLIKSAISDNYALSTASNATSGLGLNIIKIQF